MPFGATWSDNVYDAIRQACDEVARSFVGLRAERADDITEPGRITDQITSAIERADVLIADVTNLNPNVLFELGYGDALGKSIIVVNQDADATPFDIKDWRQIPYAEQSLKPMRLTLVDFLTGTLLRAGFVRVTVRPETTDADDIID
jgi:nucleoside 2-deoxyribosyltransferase